jgi:hypothetical protein
VLFYKCIGNAGAKVGISYAPIDHNGTLPKSAYVNAYEVFFVDCQLFGDGTQSIYGFFGNGSRLVFLNTAVGKSGVGTIRFNGWERGVMRHCSAEAPWGNTSVHALKIHSGGPTAYADNWLASGGQDTNISSIINWLSSKMVIANNKFGGGNNGVAHALFMVAVAPENDNEGAAGWQPLEYAILENNQFIHASAWVLGNLDIAWGGKCFISRGNSVVQGSGSFEVGKGHAQVSAYNGPYFTN